MDEMLPRGADAEPALDERPPEIGGAERRRHVRAYNLWVSLLRGRPYPSLADLDGTDTAEFAPHAVLLDFTGGGDPAIARLGDRLRGDIAGDAPIRTIADVPPRSLLDRLTKQYGDILANRAPIGFEAEFVDRQGAPMLYRGILMPFSSDGDRIDYVYGVIGWKAMIGMTRTHGFVMAMDETAVRPSLTRDADPEASPGETDGDTAHPTRKGSLAASLATAREGARAAEHAEIGARATLLAALGQAHDIRIDAEADPDGAAAVFATGESGSAPTPCGIAALVFGDTMDASRVAELADVLAHAKRLAIPRGGLSSHAEGLRGGIRAMVSAERAAAARSKGGDADLVILVARRRTDGDLEIVTSTPHDSALPGTIVGNGTCGSP